MNSPTKISSSCSGPPAKKLKDISKSIHDSNLVNLFLMASMKNKGCQPKFKQFIKYKKNNKKFTNMPLNSTLINLCRHINWKYYKKKKS